MRRLNASLVVALAAFHLNAQATLLQPDEYKTNTPTWLTLSETIGLSMDDFSKGVGGWNSVYRLASGREISLMLDGLDVTEGGSGWTTTHPGAGAFVFRIGGTAHSGFP